jgi:hypothetical protein
VEHVETLSARNNLVNLLQRNPPGGAAALEGAELEGAASHYAAVMHGFAVSSPPRDSDPPKLLWGPY